MSTLQELVRYCSEEKHLGALLLTGEWGCGKTYLIENNLREALKETHFIVRVSLLGVDSVEALNNAIRKQWLLVCTPFLGKLKQERDRLKYSGNILSALNGILQSLSPVGGNIASAIVSTDPLEYIPLEPIVEDFHNKGVKKRVVLVFDDLNRSSIGWSMFVGTINEYCENKGFTTIVIGDEQTINAASEFDVMLYKTIKEKTIARTVRYVPDYHAIIHNIVSQSSWPSQEYQEFLTENEQKIRDVFFLNPSGPRIKISKYHNIRSLIGALQEFYRLYEILTEHQASDIDQYLCSFIIYTIISRNGINISGKPSFANSEEDIKLLYPEYSSKPLPNSVQQWIENGIWDDGIIQKELIQGEGPA